MTPEDVVQTVAWVVVTNQVTGQAVYSTDTTGYPVVDSPVVSGFRVDIEQVPGVDVASPTSEEPVSSVVVVTYTAVPETGDAPEEPGPGGPEDADDEPGSIYETGGTIVDSRGLWLILTASLLGLVVLVGRRRRETLTFVDAV